MSETGGDTGVHMYGERREIKGRLAYQGTRQSSFKTFAFILLYFDRLLGLLSSTRGYLNLIWKSNLLRIDGCTVQSLAVALTCRSQLIYIFSPHQPESVTVPSQYSIIDEGVLLLCAATLKRIKSIPKISQARDNITTEVSKRANT